MRPRTELYAASILLIAALCFARFALGRSAFADPSPAPPKPPVRYDPAPVSGNDPAPDKGWGAPADPGNRPVVQIAILLDTSSSMEGLIDQARTQLWRIVNEFGRSRRAGQRPQIEVALYEYGKSSLPAQQGYIRRIAPFTTDLDGLSESLFALQTNGGDEYCGWVLRDAIRNLDWRPARDGNLRVVFIAGNEPFTQGPVDYRGICRDAAEKGVIVNTIFCGDAREGSATGWAAGAAMAGGRYLSIDQNQRQVYVPAPQDDEIRTLNEQLNQTYLPYGAHGGAKAERQSAQDAACAGASSEAYIQRAEAKANSAVYNNASWDLGDAVKGGKAVGSVSEAELPAAVRAVPAPQRQAYVEGKVREREAIQAKIKTLSAERQRYLSSRKPSGEDRSLQAVVLQTVHDQGGAKGYVFK